MDTRQLRAFLKIIDSSSISRAAQSLGLAQPSLSQQLLRLEDEVGIALFRRTARGVTLTEGGRLFAEHARDLIHRADRAIEDVRALRDDAGGEVILALPPSLSRIAGMTLVEAFLRHAPKIRLRLVEALTGTIRGWLEQGKIDLGVLHELGPHRNLSARPLAREELWLVGLPGLPETVPPEALATLSLILPGPQHGLRQVIEHEASRCGVALEVCRDLDALQWLAPLVAAGHGHAIAPLPAVAEALAAGQVSAARIGEAGWWRTLALMRNNSEVVTHASVRGEHLAANVRHGLIRKRLWVAEPLGAPQLTREDRA